MKKVFIVDNDKEYKNQLKQFINKTDTLKLISEAENGDIFLELLPASTSDIVILNIGMPETNGIELIRKALQVNPKMLIIIHSAIENPTCFFNIIQAGAKGWVSRSSSFQELYIAIEKITLGEYYFSDDVLANANVNINLLVEDFSNRNKVKDELDKAEKDVLLLMTNSYLNNDISQQLKINVQDVDRIQKKLLKKTNTKNTVSLMMYTIATKLNY